ncbi:MAG: maleylpyruvate isomerase family mycothiol-dependent enzyme [Acidimicrobiia bacterium]
MTLRPAARILLVAVEEIGRVLSEGTATDQNLTTACDPWTVRDVLAHCSGSMLRAIEDRTHRFTPEDNELDVEERRSWEFDRVRDELQATAQPTAARIDAAEGPLDGLGLGVWVHCGDIRDALGIDDAYSGPGLNLGLGLLAERSRRLDFRPSVTVDGRTIEVGAGPDRGTLVTDPETFVRMTGGRDPDPARYRLEGAEPAEFVLFG